MLSFLKRTLLGGARAGEGAAGALAGDFDIRDGIISGWVYRVPCVANGTITVRAMRGHRIIATCVAGDLDEGWRVSFTMRLGDQFSLAELACEAVRISAVNERGDTGELVLQGTTRLELIRRYMGVPVIPILDIDLCCGGNAQPYLGKGWSDPEPSLRWMLDTESFIHFDSPPDNATYFLRLNYSAFISDYIHIQPLDVFINDSLIASFTENTWVTNFREFRFNGDCFSGVAKSTMRFSHPGAARPSDVAGSSDGRRLSLCISQLSVMQIIAEGT